MIKICFWVLITDRCTCVRTGTDRLTTLATKNLLTLISYINLNPSVMSVEQKNNLHDFNWTYIHPGLTWVQPGPT